MSEHIGSRDLIDDLFFFTTGETETRNEKLFICGPFMVACRYSDFHSILFLVNRKAAWAVSTFATMQSVYF